jgi:hypothetical protein
MSKKKEDKWISWILGGLIIAFGVWVITWGSGGWFFPVVGIIIVGVGLPFVLFPHKTAKAAKEQHKQQVRERAAQEQTKAPYSGDESDEQSQANKHRAKRLAERTNTVEEYNELSRQLENAEDADETEVLDDALELAGGKQIGWWLDDELPVYDTKAEAEKAAQTSENYRDIDVVPAYLSDVAEAYEDETE